METNTLDRIDHLFHADPFSVKRHPRPLFSDRERPPEQDLLVPVGIRIAATVSLTSSSVNLASIASSLLVYAATAIRILCAYR